MPLSLTRWRESEPEEIRSWITEVNDGIIAVAGMGLGLAGADVEARTTYAVVIINAFVGALVAFGAKLGERLADVEAERDLIGHESQRLAMTPDEERAEIVAWFEEKGVSTTTPEMAPKKVVVAGGSVRTPPVFLPASRRSGVSFSSRNATISSRNATSSSDHAISMSHSICQRPCSDHV